LHYEAAGSCALGGSVWLAGATLGLAELEQGGPSLQFGLLAEGAAQVLVL